MFLAGGVAVAAFAALGDTLRPKSFAGLFGAAPSIALATLVTRPAYSPFERPNTHLVFTTDDLRAGAIDSTHVFGPAPHENSRLGGPIAEVGLGAHQNWHKPEKQPQAYECTKSVHCLPSVTITLRHHAGDRQSGPDALSARRRARSASNRSSIA
jgi:hypothetical protein